MNGLSNLIGVKVNYESAVLNAENEHVGASSLQSRFVLSLKSCRAV